MRAVLLLCVLLVCVSSSSLEDCVSGAWGPWSPCNVSCGEGQQMRTRAVHVAPNSVGQSEHCPPLLEWRVCHLPECALDCVLSEWSPWTRCSASCGWGLQRRARDVRVFPRGGGRSCGPVLEERECSLGNCAVDCVVSPWSDWGRCLDGATTRTRTIVHAPNEGGLACPSLAETRPCTGGESSQDSQDEEEEQQPVPAVVPRRRRRSRRSTSTDDVEDEDQQGTRRNRRSNRRSNRRNRSNGRSSRRNRLRRLQARRLRRFFRRCAAKSKPKRKRCFRRLLKHLRRKWLRRALRRCDKLDSASAKRSCFRRAIQKRNGGRRRRRNRRNGRRRRRNGNRRRNRSRRGGKGNNRRNRSRRGGKGNRRRNRSRRGGRLHSRNPFHRGGDKKGGRCRWRLRNGDKGFCCRSRRRSRCVGGCPWCSRRRSVQSIFASASHVAAVRVRTRGKLMNTARGASHLWSAAEFEHVSSIRHAHDCDVSHMDLIRTVDGREGKCRTLKPGKVYVVSGQCRNGVFYLDPCGVRMRLGKRNNGSRKGSRRRGLRSSNPYRN